MPEPSSIFMAVVAAGTSVAASWRGLQHLARWALPKMQRKRQRLAQELQENVNYRASLHAEDEREEETFGAEFPPEVRERRRLREEKRRHLSRRAAQINRKLRHINKQLKES